VKLAPSRDIKHEPIRWSYYYACRYLAANGPATADMVGAVVWKGKKRGKTTSMGGGGDYAAQMLLGRMKKAGLVMVDVEAQLEICHAVQLLPDDAARAHLSLDDTLLGEARALRRGGHLHAHDIAALIVVHRRVGSLLRTERRAQAVDAIRSAKRASHADTHARGRLDVEADLYGGL
jgi:hypothetical protein